MKTYELKSSDDNYDYPETGTPNSLNSQLEFDVAVKYERNKSETKKKQKRI